MTGATTESRLQAPFLTTVAPVLARVTDCLTDLTQLLHIITALKFQITIRAWGIAEDQLRVLTYFISYATQLDA